MEPWNWWLVVGRCTGKWQLVDGAQTGSEVRNIPTVKFKHIFHKFLGKKTLFLTLAPYPHLKKT